MKNKIRSCNGIQIRKRSKPIKPGRKGPSWPKDIIADISDEEFSEKFEHKHDYNTICLFCMRFALDYGYRMLKHRSMSKQKALFLLDKEIRQLTVRIVKPAEDPRLYC